MTTNVTFENVAIADALSKASRVAPTKGEGFDKAAGILIEVDPNLDYAVIRSTNLAVTYEQRVKHTAFKGDKAMWRIPSGVLSGIASSLPKSDGKVCEFIDRGDSWIRLKSDRLLTKLATIPLDEYPLRAFVNYDPSMLAPASDMAAKVEMVSWATDGQKPKLSGVYMNGEELVAVNMYSCARIPTSMPIDRPVSVPLKTLAGLLKQASDVRIAASGDRFLLMLDADTKCSAVLIAEEFPNYKGLCPDDYLYSVRFHRQTFMETLERILNIARQDKLPTLTLKIDGAKFVKDITFDIEVTEVGRMMDSVDITTDTFDGTEEIHFIPSFLYDAVNNSKADYMTLQFGRPNGRPATETQVEFSDDSEYRVVLIPKRK